MKSKLYLVLAFILYVVSSAFSQTLGNSFEQTVSAASVTAYSTSHVVVEYSIPSNATGCIVRFATKSKGQSFTEPSLSSLLALLPKSELTQGINLAKFALGNSDDNDVDFEVLSTPTDANAFTNTFLKYYNCMLFSNTVSACFYLDKNLNDKVYFAINNRNYFQGVNVKVEVVPVYANSAHTYTLQVHNDTDKELSFDVQNDNESTWYPMSLSAGEYSNINVSTSKTRIRIATNGIYKTRIAYTYKRQWLQWDNENKLYDITVD